METTPIRARPRPGQGSSPFPSSALISRERKGRKDPLFKRENAEREGPSRTNGRLRAACAAGPAQNCPLPLSHLSTRLRCLLPWLEARSSPRCQDPAACIPRGPKVLVQGFVERLSEP